VEGFELLLAEFACDDDGGEQAEAHSGEDTLLDGFDAGELGDVAGADVEHGHLLVELEAVAASALGKQQGLAGHVGGLDGSLGGERMAGMRKQEDSLGAEQDGLDGGVGAGLDHADGHVELAGFKHEWQDLVVLRAKDELNMGEAAVEEAEDGRQAVGEHALRDADAEGAAGLGAGLDRALALLHGGEGLLGEGEKVPPGIGKRYAAAEAVKEWDAQLFFEGLDLRGDVGLHGMDFLGRAGEVELRGEGAKDFELSDFHGATSDPVLSPNQIEIILSIYWTDEQVGRRLGE